MLVTGQDIIFFWVARMIMAGYEFENKKPFSDVYFTGMVRDKQGRKMSKIYEALRQAELDRARNGQAQSDNGMNATNTSGAVLDTEPTVRALPSTLRLAR